MNTPTPPQIEHSLHDSSATFPFYQHALTILNEAKVPFLVGGAYALRYYTGIIRDTKDLDLFLHPRDQSRAMEIFGKAGYEIQMTAPHWITKAYDGHEFVDFIFGLANGLGEVDDSWFEHASEWDLMDRRVALIPAEEMIWSKAFIMERERFDGADINHVIRARAQVLDWDRLLSRFGAHWRVLLAHLIAFGFAYPAERSRIPAKVLEPLLRRAAEEGDEPPDADGRLCRGTLLSRYQYVKDIQEDGFLDARILPAGKLTPEQALQ
jgi:hypothetical protein